MVASQSFHQRACFSSSASLVRLTPRAVFVSDFSSQDLKPCFPHHPDSPAQWMVAFRFFSSLWFGGSLGFLSFLFCKYRQIEITPAAYVATLRSIFLVPHCSPAARLKEAMVVGRKARGFASIPTSRCPHHQAHCKSLLAPPPLSERADYSKDRNTSTYMCRLPELSQYVYVWECVWVRRLCSQCNACWYLM